MHHANSPQGVLSSSLASLNPGTGVNSLHTMNASVCEGRTQCHKGCVTRGVSQGCVARGVSPGCVTRSVSQECDTLISMLNLIVKTHKNTTYVHTVSYTNMHIICFYCHYMYIYIHIYYTIVYIHTILMYIKHTTLSANALIVCMDIDITLCYEIL